MEYKISLEDLVANLFIENFKNNDIRRFLTYSEIEDYESDSLHDCFGWAFANAKILYSDLHNEEVWCVYWSDFSENYYMCPDKGDETLDDVCFRGSEKECDEFYQKHYIHD